MHRNRGNQGVVVVVVVGVVVAWVGEPAGQLDAGVLWPAEGLRLGQDPDVGVLATQWAHWK